MVLLVLATASNSGALFLAGAIIGGGRFGPAFLGGPRALTAVIPLFQSETRRLHLCIAPSRRECPDAFTHSWASRRRDCGRC
jgi:hypothetical protein